MDLSTQLNPLRNWIYLEYLQFLILCEWKLFFFSFLRAFFVCIYHGFEEWIIAIDVFKVRHLWFVLFFVKLWPQSINVEESYFFFNSKIFRLVLWTFVLVFFVCDWIHVKASYFFLFFYYFKVWSAPQLIYFNKKFDLTILNISVCPKKI